MAYRGQGQKVQKVMVQPINLIFRYLQNRSHIQVWLYEQVNMRIEGCIIVSTQDILPQSLLFKEKNFLKDGQQSNIQKNQRPTPQKVLQDSLSLSHCST